MHVFQLEEKKIIHLKNQKVTALVGVDISM